MRDINRVFLVGRLGKDPEIRLTAASKLVATLSLATNRPVREGEGWGEVTDWHRIVLFEWAAKRAQTHLHKGDPVAVEGHLRYRRWKDDSGRDRWTTEIVAKELNVFPRGTVAPGAAPVVVTPHAEPPAEQTDDIPF